MTIVLTVIGFLAAAVVARMVIIAVRSNGYHDRVRKIVCAELGLIANPYLEARAVTEMISSAYRRGEPVSSIARSLVLIILAQEADL
ncbi:MAG: hypothetical protein J0I16_03110 [Rhizobiales bacterium]|nr:hypothetical protein [Hyphomicrobiales bacterium]